MGRTRGIPPIYFRQGLTQNFKNKQFTLKFAFLPTFFDLINAEIYSKITIFNSMGKLFLECQRDTLRSFDERGILYFEFI